ncbi:hypothetical protein BayCH28_22330 [Mycolicibacterium sp. CH28]|uniref:hypothetical protein n=1 Tax=Mycolicibacterium sp. CH28 TaxID=2512237 RepID=UPI0010802946|nr:hypothetical protein [Mycolicibacterium sp. CH28]TGD85141.1 hypothetical protein BayCH28_22330 [Mycolicibacterium sp. CH28]
MTAGAQDDRRIIATKDGKSKNGKDKKLETEAAEWLARDVGPNKRSLDRDIEKMQYEFGSATRNELGLYDPDNDWDALDSAFSIFVRPGADITPSLCTADDGNVRARSREDPKTPAGVWGRAGEEERRGLSRHVGDDDDWGSAYEKEIPPLGKNEREPGTGKRCTRCQLVKRIDYFGPDKRNSDGLRSSCRQCDRDTAKAAYARKAG